MKNVLAFWRELDRIREAIPSAEALAAQAADVGADESAALLALRDQAGACVVEIAKEFGLDIIGDRGDARAAMATVLALQHAAAQFEAEHGWDRDAARGVAASVLTDAAINNVGERPHATPR